MEGMFKRLTPLCHLPAARVWRSLTHLGWILPSPWDVGCRYQAKRAFREIGTLISLSEDDWWLRLIGGQSKYQASIRRLLQNFRGSVYIRVHGKFKNFIDQPIIPQLEQKMKRVSSKSERRPSRFWPCTERKNPRICSELEGWKVAAPFSFHTFGDHLKPIKNRGLS